MMMMMVVVYASTFSGVICMVTILHFNLLTSKSNQFICVPKCTKIVNSMKFPQVADSYNHKIHKLSGRMATSHKHEYNAVIMLTMLCLVHLINVQ